MIAGALCMIEVRRAISHWAVDVAALELRLSTVFFRAQSCLADRPRRAFSTEKANCSNPMPPYQVRVAR